MNIILYLAYNNDYLEYFTSYFNNEDIPVNISECFMGYRVEAQWQESRICDISETITRFIIEFYFKEAILSKVYDEYINLDVNDAVKLLTELSENNSSTLMYMKICDILKKCGSLCIDSFIIFNIKPIMQDVYEKVDYFAENQLFSKEKEAFADMIRTYCTLNGRKYRDALVEFSEEDMCRVELDTHISKTVSTDRVLALLTECSPEKIILKNADCCPEISGLLKDIFRERVCKQ